MAECNLGFLAITRGGWVSGLFSESDLLRCAVGPVASPAPSRPMRSVRETKCRCSKIESALGPLRRCRPIAGVGYWCLAASDSLTWCTIPGLAHAMAAAGSITLSVAAGVIVLLGYELPDILRMADGLLRP